MTRSASAHRNSAVGGLALRTVAVELPQGRDFADAHPESREAVQAT
jgi:hypothetical protein